MKWAGENLTPHDLYIVKRLSNGTDTLPEINPYWPFSILATALILYFLKPNGCGCCENIYI
jgi:hypothetical protein